MALYGKGGRDNSKLCVTAQTKLELSADGLTTTAPVFVQPTSEVPCLLGTNVLPKLGVKVLRANGQAIGEEPSVPDLTSVSRVSVIHSTYAPSRRATFIEAELQCPLIGSDTLVFEPNQASLKAVGLDATDSLLIRRPDGRVWVPVENCVAVSIRLEPGTCIGSVTCVSDVQKAPCDDVRVPEEPEAQCFGVKAESPERLECLLTALQLTRGMLTHDQFQRLKKLIGDNADVFALDSSDLGHTDLDNHHVDTSDHPPIKQPARHVPFVY